MAGSQRRSDTSPSFSAACSVRFHAPEQSAERRLLSARTVETALGTRSLHLLGWLVMASFLLPTSVARVLTVCTHDPHMLYAMRSSLFNFQGDQISMAYVQYADMTPLIGTGPPARLFLGSSCAWHTSLLSLRESNEINWCISFWS